MKKVATRAELVALSGGKPAAVASTAPTTSQPDASIQSLQAQVAAVTLAVGKIADAVRAQAEVQAARPNVLEATIQRDAKGVAQKIIITRAKE